MRLGIFGGTFDPPHLGHLILAAEAHHQLGLDRLLWVLTPHSPLKQGQLITPLHHRLDMLQAAIADDPAFELSRVDVDRSPPHYAVDTVRILGTQFPAAELIYLIGGDSLRDLPLWRRPRELVAACHTLGVMRRPGDEIDLASLETAIPGISQKVQFLETPRLEISASEIRRRVAESRPFRYYLPPAVYRLIQERRLYR